LAQFDSTVSIRANYETNNGAIEAQKFWISNAFMQAHMESHSRDRPVASFRQSLPTRPGYQVQSTSKLHQDTFYPARFKAFYPPIQREEVS
jgi:hypothetical protein